MRLPTLRRPIGQTRLGARPIDTAIRSLSQSANKGRLWLGIAAVGLAIPGRTRRAAVRGAGSLAATSLAVNAAVKPLIRRRRPDITLTPLYRRLTRQPWTTSFPSGHAASAAAFTVGAAMEFPAASIALAPLGTLIGYSRVHVGVHHVSDVLSGMSLGAVMALLTMRWWPVRSHESAEARTRIAAPALPRGQGMVVVVNPRAQNGDDARQRIQQLLPAANVIELTPGLDLDAELTRRAENLLVLGAAGGDGTMSAIARTALSRDLPVALFPSGTLNHFARDVGLEGVDDTALAVETGQAVAVDVATVNGAPFLNTSSIGAYPELVRRRDQLAPTVGRWLAMAIATAQVLRDQKPMELVIDGRPTTVWTLFVGNGRYAPRGSFPRWRPRLDDGLLDVQLLAAGTLSRTRAVLATLAGVAEHSHAYRAWLTSALHVESRSGAVGIATDGEEGDRSTSFRFGKHPGRLVIYRPTASN